MVRYALANAEGLTMSFIQDRNPALWDAILNLLTHFITVSHPIVPPLLPAGQYPLSAVAGP